MKVFSINYQPIVNDRCGNALIHYLFKTFCQLDNHCVFITSSVDRKYGDNIVGHSHIVSILIKLLFFISRKLNVPYYLIRSWTEIIVDYQHFLYLKKQQTPYLLITSMYARKSVKEAKRKGCKVVLIAGNLNDELYYKAVTLEQKRLGLNYKDVYSSSYRIGIYKEMMSNIDEVWVNSNFAANTFEGKKSKVIPISYYESRGYTPKEFVSEDSDILRIGYFGYTTLLKGVHLLAEAVSKCKYKDQIRLVLAGRIDKYVYELLKRINANIEYLGFVREIDKESIIKSFDVMAVPSLYDAGPTTIYEGCECNVPLLVSNGCGGSELIENNKGCILFKTMDIDDLINKIELFYENRSLYKKVGSYTPNKFGEKGDQNNINVLKKEIMQYEIHNQG